MIESLTCPHCRKQIELVGQRTLGDEYELGPNKVIAAQQRGKFPAPVLDFGNRKMWLKSDIDRYVRELSNERIAKLVQDFEQYIAILPEDERKQARELLAVGKRR